MKKGEIFYKNPKTILNKAKGFLSGYTHSLNPYTGCSFACSYCYVRQLSVSLFRSGDWGEWVDIKKNVSELLRYELQKAKKKGKVTIYMSSSTDSYQPIESKERVTRSLLESMLEVSPDFYPLVKRDNDLLSQFNDKVRVSMSIETDEENISKYFTPEAPPIQARLKTLEVLAEAGIPTQASIAPLLPSSEDFPIKLSTVVNRICIDDYFMGDGSGGKRTTRLGIAIKYDELGLEEWYSTTAYKIVYERFKQYFSDNQIYIS